MANIMTPPLASAVHLRWNDLPQDFPMPLIARRRIIGSQVMISQVTLRKGFKVQSHHHANEQIAVVLTGEMRFGVGAEGTPTHREMFVTAGEVLHLPSNVPHSAEALVDSVLLDIFSPPSEKTGVDAHT